MLIFGAIFQWFTIDFDTSGAFNCELGAFNLAFLAFSLALSVSSLPWRMGDGEMGIQKTYSNQLLSPIFWL